MRVIIVGQNQEFLAPLAAKLQERGFEAITFADSQAVIGFAHGHSFHFLLADQAALTAEGLQRDVLSRCPLARVILLAEPFTPFGFMEALTGGLFDCFPARPEYFDEIARVLAFERERLTRWQRVLLTQAAPGGEGDGRAAA